jgi:F-type H+-transporting ATPase subunit b
MVIMGTFLLLAAEASALHSELSEEGATHGFGLNLDLFETNIINLAILVGVLVVFGRKLLTNILNERQAAIATAIQEAEQRAQQAASALSQVQEKLTQAQAEAQRIRQASEESAKNAKEAILAKAVVDVQRLKESAAADLNTERDKAIAQLRSRVVAMALQKAEAQLRGSISSDAQQMLIERSIAQLGGS